MNLIDLQKSLRSVEPAAVLVPPRVLENIIKQSCNLSGFYWTVPHRSNFIIDRQTLFAPSGGNIEQEDLALGPNELLPNTVILLAYPSSEELLADRAGLLLKYWQLLFHASVHLRLENQFNEGKLTQADLRTRISQIGLSEFDEIKNVLVQDNCLPAEVSERQIYAEFAADFLEKLYFAPGVLDSTFPGLKNKEAIQQMLERDVDGAGLFKRTRLAKAADPVVQTVATSQEAHEFFNKLVASSKLASAAGNFVLAAIQRRRAARVAPPDEAFSTMQLAQADMQNIADRLKNALDLDDAQTKEWHKDLLTLLDKADQGSRPAEAAMLYDLQKVCIDNEEPVYAPNLAEWLMSLGRRPMTRPLPSQRLVRLTRHLRSAAHRLTMARLSDQDRRHLAGLLQNGLQSCEACLRERFRQVFKDTFEDVGLKPRNAPETVAFNKVIEELLDRIVSFGFLTFSDLRDTLSRNQLKLPDLTDPSELIVGDPLLRLDRRLATLLDGVYRKGEFYLRWLEWLISLNFGTKAGRLLTMWVTLPFGLAFLILEGGNILSHLLCLLFIPAIDAPLPLLQVNTVGLMAAGQDFVPLLTASKLVALSQEQIDATRSKLGVLQTGSPLYLVMFFALAFFMVGMFHYPKMRQKVRHYAKSVLKWLQFHLVLKPMSLLSSAAIKSASKNWTVRLLYRIAFKPLVLMLLICLILLSLRILIFRLGEYLFLMKDIPPVMPVLDSAFLGWGIALFLFCIILINYTSTTDALSYSFVQILQQIRAGLLLRLFNFVVALFKNSIHFVDKMLFHVDELLLFRKGDGQQNKGDSQQGMLLRMVTTVFWFPISYLIRFNLVVFVEPFFNPLKLPVCTIAYKFYLPIYAIVQKDLYVRYWATGNYVPFLIASWVNFWLADVFGFIFWEVKENWRLYRENRRPTLEPVSIGPDGETLSGLLQPGFHSGTVPKLYRRLREAERLALETGKWSGVRACQEELTTVAKAVRLFLVRDFVALLDQEPLWRNQGYLNHQIQIGLTPYAQEQGMVVGKVHLATNQIRVELIHPRFEETPLQLEFTSRGPWMLAGFGNVGWLHRLSEKEYRPLHNALITLYKLAGVDLIREQLQAVLPPEAANSDLSPLGIFIRQDGRPNPVIYDLTTPADVIGPQLLDGLPVEGWPTVNCRQLLFKRMPITWDECIRCWQPQGPGQAQSMSLAPEVELLPHGILLEMQKRWHAPGPNGSNGTGNGSEAKAEPEANGEATKPKS